MFWSPSPRTYSNVGGITYNGYDVAFKNEIIYTIKELK